MLDWLKALDSLKSHYGATGEPFWYGVLSTQDAWVQIYHGTGSLPLWDNQVLDLQQNGTPVSQIHTRPDPSLTE